MTHVRARDAAGRCRRAGAGPGPGLARLRPARARAARRRRARLRCSGPPVPARRSTARSSRRACPRARRPSRSSPSPTAGARTIPVAVATQTFGRQRVRTVIPKLRGRRARHAGLPLADPAARRVRRRADRADPTRPVRAVPHSRRYAGVERIWVYPRDLELPTLPVGQNRNLEGPSSELSPQGTVTFHRLREYHDGDDLRLVHWRSSARAGTADGAAQRRHLPAVHRGRVRPASEPVHRGLVRGGGGRRGVGGRSRRRPTARRSSCG